MSKIWTAFLNDCEMVLNDEANAIWTRNKFIAWGEEALLSHPFLRPMQNAYHFLADANYVDLPADFREMITVEYPVSQTPPEFLRRMSRLDPAFYDQKTNYDVDYKYSASGWRLYLSFTVLAGQDIKINYLANHATGLADDGAAVLTTKDEHVPILIAYVVFRAYQERLSTYMQDPTAYSQIINQMVASVERAHEHYLELVKLSMEKQSQSRQVPRVNMDKFDAVY